MGSTRPRLFAYAQLLRLPNLFTAVADPFAGWLLVEGAGPGWELPVLVLVSACLYSAGIVLNDCFDYQVDCRERPHRPLPSGAIRLATAWRLGYGLLVAGLVLAAGLNLALALIAASLTRPVPKLAMGLALAACVWLVAAPPPVPWQVLRYRNDRASWSGDVIHLGDRKSTRLNSSHMSESRMPSSA